MTELSRILAGIALLSLVTVEFGGVFMTRIVRGSVPMTDFQKSFARAGHAHAGVLVTLGLVCLLIADAAKVDGALGVVGRFGVLAAAIVLPGGFFASSAGKDVHQPNRAFALVWTGAAVLAVGVVALGLGVLIS
jgi:hypothetical protein